MLVVGRVDGRVRLEGRDQVRLEQVADEHPDHPDRQVEPGGDLGDGQRGAGDREDRPVLGLQVDQVGVGCVERLDVGEQAQPAGDRPGPAAGHRVRPHHRAGLLVEPVVLGSRLGRLGVVRLGRRALPRRAGSGAVGRPCA